MKMTRLMLLAGALLLSTQAMAMGRVPAMAHRRPGTRDRPASTFRPGERATLMS